MFDEINKFFKSLFKCSHKNALLHSNDGYCPDCGKYIKKAYFVVRCKRCDIKRLSKKSFDKIVPIEKYCANCGSNEYVIEKYDRLNLVDINYAIEVKETIEEFEPQNDLEIWIDEEKQSDAKFSDVPLITEIKYLTAQ